MRLCFIFITGTASLDYEILENSRIM
ncbi:MAG: hypothetical protein ACI9HJ_002105, partial [Ulvibacter sp.]